MKRLAYCTIGLFLCVPFISHGQGTWLNDKLIKQGTNRIKKIDNTFFKEYFEVFIEQPVDHANPEGPKFLQRFTIGFNDTLAPTVMETEGYSMEWQLKKGYINELGYRIKG
ncbi:MAG TPA: hypothetical protein VD905_04375, partial [Flavobacteriales bacterium]|nr:hypothetical protein [Flavobacteriales bacterium]